MSTIQRTPVLTLGILSLMAMGMASCGGDPNSPGMEYMPDMYRSPAVEAYVDYGQDPYYFTEDTARVQRDRPSAKLPPEGTIAFAEDPTKVAFHMPYPYANTNEGYEAAGLGLKSPIAMTEATVAQGKVIYDKFCDHCHGAKGEGDGSVVNNGGHPPPGSYTTVLKNIPEGKIFHVITYGKGMMGAHASQLDKEERWLVVQYVKYLQNGGRMTSEAAGDSTALATTPNPAVN
ncbi:MAG: cytochrome c [Flavobacteriales bacterium]|jgi:mono/diheme cytochrome c family protein|nr:cytochrome c [Flavobacteriales bacterium]